MIDPEDAKHITIPVCILPSKDEDVDDIKAFQKNLTVDNHVETFGDQVHGWMGARSVFIIGMGDEGNTNSSYRADLENDRIRSEYERGYKTVLEFFLKYL